MVVQWERMFVDQLEERFHDYPVVYFPYGLCEPHGPQCVLGTDAFLAHGLLCETAKKYGGIVAPLNYWHIAEAGGEAAWAHEAIGQVKRTWLTSISPSMFYKNLCYHIRTADSMGFHAAILLSGHEGPLVQDMKRITEVMQPYVGTRLLALAPSEVRPHEYGMSRHAGRIETSELMAHNPDCVDITRIGSVESPGNQFGMGSDAAEANRVEGEKMIMSEIVGLGEMSQMLRKEYEAIKPQHTLITFEQVESIWEREITPVLPDFEMMQDLFREGNQSAVPGESCWYDNWLVSKRRWS